jgi:hypothetical protein
MKNLDFLKNSILLITLSVLFVNCSSDNNKENDPNASSKTFLAVVDIDYVETGNGYSTVCGNSVKADGHTPVTSRGMCWGTSLNPTIELNNKTVDGSGIGNYKSIITNLQPNTSYYLRAYATNSVGTSYSNVKIFNSDIGDPKLSTTSATDILQTTAVCGGNIINNGGIEITHKGVCWSVNPNPTYSYNNSTSNGSGTGSFKSVISGLKSGTTYYVRAYAANFDIIPTRIGYGNEIVIATNNSTIPINGLVAWYSFNGNANDASLNNNNGIINGATLTTDRFGNQNSAFSFDGIRSYIQVPSSASLSNVASITISGWFNTSNFTSDQGLVTKWFTKNIGYGNTDAYSCILSKNTYTNNIPSIIGATDTYRGYDLKTSNSIPINTWTHFVFTHDNHTGGKLYINGRLEATIVSNQVICTSTNPLIIGGDNNMNNIYRLFNGKLDDIGIWNRALTPTEIQQLYIMTN